MIQKSAFTEWNSVAKSSENHWQRRALQLEALLLMMIEQWKRFSHSFKSDFHPSSLCSSVVSAFNFYENCFHFFWWFGSGFVRLLLWWMLMDQTRVVNLLIHLLPPITADTTSLLSRCAFHPLLNICLCSFENFLGKFLLKISIGLKNRFSIASLLRKFINMKWEDSIHPVGKISFVVRGKMLKVY